MVNDFEVWERKERNKSYEGVATGFAPLEALLLYLRQSNR
jgi:hypothetical protein